MQHLAWPQWVAVAAGATLEALGVAILATALELYRYNGTKRKSDPPAPMLLAVGLVGLYLVAALKADAKAQRARRRAERKRKAAEPAMQQDATPMQVMEPETKTAQVIRLAELHPDWIPAQLAAQVGCSASTVTRALKRRTDADILS